MNEDLNPILSDYLKMQDSIVPNITIRNEAQGQGYATSFNTQVLKAINCAHKFEKTFKPTV